MHRNNNGQRRAAVNQLRRGLSLIEICAALVLMSFTAAISTNYFTKAASGVVETSNAAHSLRQQLEAVRLESIKTGIPHGLRFHTSKGRVVGITAIRLLRGREQSVSLETRVSDNVRIVSRQRRILFDVEGATSANFDVRVESPTRKWNLEIVSVTGTVRIKEL